MAADREVGGRPEATRPEPKVRLGVGFLAYNEEELIAKTVAEAVSSLSAIPGLTWHVVVVNDGSRDRTGEIAEEIARKDPRISVVHHDGNKGYAVATETALRNVPGEVVMVVDGDGQHTMADAPKFLEAIKANGAASVKEPGCRMFNIHVSAKDPNHVFLYEVYDNAAALDSHRQTDHFKKYAATTKDMVTKRDARPMTAVALNSKGH